MDRKKSRPQVLRSMSTEPKAATPEVQDIDKGRPFSVEPLLQASKEDETENSSW